MSEITIIDECAEFTEAQWDRLKVPKQSNVYVFPSRHLRVIELVNYWNWRGYMVSTDAHTARINNNIYINRSIPVRSARASAGEINMAIIYLTHPY